MLTSRANGAAMVLYSSVGKGADDDGPSNDTFGYSFLLMIHRRDLRMGMWNSAELPVAIDSNAKACRRANIPVPERGYWARVAAGQNVHWTPLPNQTPDAPNVVKFKSQPPTDGQTP